MLPALGADRRSGAQWGMFTAADKATTDYTSATTPFLSFAGQSSMRVNDATDRLFVFGDQDVCPISCGYASTCRHERCILECGVAADGDRTYVHRAPKRHGRLDASHGRGWDPGAFTIGEWVTLAFTYNAVDGQTRTFNAESWWKCSRRADGRYRVPVPSSSRARAPWTWSMSHVAAQAIGCARGRTRGLAYTPFARARPGFATLDVSMVSGLARTSRSPCGAAT
jgi:hypothetical protein